MVCTQNTKPTRIAETPNDPMQEKGLPVRTNLFYESVKCVFYEEIKQRKFAVTKNKKTPTPSPKSQPRLSSIRQRQTESENRTESGLEISRGGFSKWKTGARKCFKGWKKRYRWSVSVLRYQRSIKYQFNYFFCVRSVKQWSEMLQLRGKTYLILHCVLWPNRRRH